MKVCKICGKNKATVPDRNYQNVGRLRLEVCGQCHAERLKNDLVGILLIERKRRQQEKRAAEK